ncbi:hypothetical protein K440DRAFT_109764 [Wilcoxina mikolae CBS 423.85]|nr:hypothetical protein K440DRAFT_109764 [Wilcoxina mikolae CBS 423.85]
MITPRCGGCSSLGSHEFDWMIGRSQSKGRLKQEKAKRQESWLSFFPRSWSRERQLDWLGQGLDNGLVGWMCVAWLSHFRITKDDSLTRPVQHSFWHLPQPPLLHSLFSTIHPFFPSTAGHPRPTSTILHYSHPARHRQSSSNLAALSLSTSLSSDSPLFPGSASLALLTSSSCFRVTADCRVPLPFDGLPPSDRSRRRVSPPPPALPLDHCQSSFSRHHYTVASDIARV